MASTQENKQVKIYLTVALSLHCSLRRLRTPNLTIGVLALGKVRISEGATWEIVT